MKNTTSILELKSMLGVEGGEGRVRENLVSSIFFAVYVVYLSAVNWKELFSWKNIKTYKYREVVFQGPFSY